MYIPEEVYPFPAFRGLDLKDAPLNTPAQFSRRAKFVDFDLLGAVAKAKGPVYVNGTQITGNPAVLGTHEYYQTDGDKFFIVYTGNGKLYKVDYSTGAVTDISPSNVTIASSAYPHFFTFNGLCIMGDGTNQPIYIYDAVTSAKIFHLGLTAPATGLTATPGAAGNLNGAYLYKVVFTSPTGAKSNAGPASTVSNPANQKNDLTNIPTYGGTAENVTKREIYRTPVGGTVYYYLDTLNDNTTVIYTDDKTDAQLGERLIEEREKPLAGLWGFTEYNGSVYGFVKNTHNLLYSQINESEAWGAFNIEPITPGDGQFITGLGKLARLVVFKERSIHTWEGVPGLFRRVQRSGIVGCKSHRTIKSVSLPNGGDVLIFLANDGVYAFDEQDVTYISREIEPIFNGKDATYNFNASRGNQAVAEYSPFDKKYYLSIPVNSASDNNLLLVYDLYASSWSVREPFYCGSMSLRTESDGKLAVVGGDSRSDATYGGRVLKLESADANLGLDYSGEYVTVWNSLNQPNNRKLLRHLEIDVIAGGEYNLFIDLYVDGADSPALTRTVLLSTGGGVWDQSNWDEADYVGDTFLTKIIGMNKIQARFISVGFRTEKKDQSWKILAARMMYQVLPQAGDRK